MASHHRHPHPHCHHPSTTPTTCLSCSCNCCPTTPPQPQPQPQPLDPLIQTLLSQLLLQPQPPQTPPFHHSHKKHIFQHQKIKQDHTILSSLIHRIDALETSLHHLSSSSYNKTTSSSSYSSLKDMAARVIQTHFRAYLVHRSRTLRHLKDLTSVKASFNKLRSSFSEQTHQNPEVFSHKAMDLLLKLDSIQGGDPMIRDGKRSISRDLIRFLDYIDGVCIKRHEVYVKNVRFDRNGVKSRGLEINGRRSGGGKRVMVEKIRDQIEDDDEEVEECCDGSDDEESPRILSRGRNDVSEIRNGILVKRSGGQNKVKKSVSFVRDGVAVGGKREQLESLRRKVEEMESLCRGEDEEEANTESGGSSQISDDESHESKWEAEGSALSAPEPVKMESRAEFLKRKAANS